MGDVINVQAVYTDGATRYNLQSIAAVNYSMFSGAHGLAGAYQSIGFANAPDAVHAGTSAANGTGLENVRTWGFRGGYTHHWDPWWNTGVYGAYAGHPVRQQRQNRDLRERGCLAGPGRHLQPRLQHRSGRHHHALDAE